MRMRPEPEVWREQELKETQGTLFLLFWTSSTAMQRNICAKIGFGFFHAPLLGERFGQVLSGVRQTGMQTQRQLELLSGVRQVAARHKDDAQVVVIAGIVRPDRYDFAVMVSGFAEAAQLEKDGGNFLVRSRVRALDLQ